jgi:tRNA(fMet)-specific endonuclease VapC
MMYMFDTNTVSYLIKGSSVALKDKFMRHKPEELTISSLVCAELLYGIKKKGKPDIEKKIRAFLGQIRTTEFDSRAAEFYAVIRAELENSGTPLDNMDLLIAASAMAAGAVLVTHNVKHFSRIKGLGAEDWC